MACSILLLLLLLLLCFARLQLYSFVSASPSDSIPHAFVLYNVTVLPSRPLFIVMLFLFHLHLLPHPHTFLFLRLFLLHFFTLSVILLEFFSSSLCYFNQPIHLCSMFSHVSHKQTLQLISECCSLVLCMNRFFSCAFCFSFASFLVYAGSDLAILSSNPAVDSFTSGFSYPMGKTLVPRLISN